MTKDIRMDSQGENGQWMTYEDAGKHLGRSAEAVRKLSRRLRWQVRPANDSHGKAHIFVPDTAQAMTGRAVVDRPEFRPEFRPDMTMEARQLRDELLAKEKALGDIREKLARAESSLDGYQQLVGRLDRDLSRTREQADRAEDQREAERAGRIAAEAAQAEAHARRQAVEEELARLEAGGRLARVWRALVR
jgi:hypothetical protein